jgi:hypothetical protein
LLTKAAAEEGWTSSFSLQEKERVHIIMDICFLRAQQKLGVVFGGLVAARSVKYCLPRLFGEKPQCLFSEKQRLFAEEPSRVSVRPRKSRHVCPFGAERPSRAANFNLTFWSKRGRDFAAASALTFWSKIGPLSSLFCVL